MTTDTIEQMGKALAERGPAIAPQSLWRKRAEALVELRYHLAPHQSRIMTFEQLCAAVPAHLLDLSQELHAAEAARANVRQRAGAVERSAMDLGAYDVFMLPLLRAALDPLAQEAFEALHVGDTLPSIDDLAGEYVTAVSNQRSEATSFGVALSRDSAEIKRHEDAVKQKARDLAGETYRSIARLIAHPNYWQSSFAGRLPDVAR